ncbi:hypothetical protein ACFQ3P_42865 [Paraburkholderia sabiae]|uniref:hypothetical protein n=1 Tax=Paraburkholderia sabiae TaxID=273251 RepID=UPI00319E1FF1
MPPYNQDVKDQITSRIISSNETLETVSTQTGVPVHTLEMWRAQAMAKSARALGWTPRQMLEVVSGGMLYSDIKERTAWLAKQNASLMDFDCWTTAARDGLRAFGQVKRGEAKATRLRIKVLERDLRKKDKAMAAAAAQFWNGYENPD